MNGYRSTLQEPSLAGKRGNNAAAAPTLGLRRRGRRTWTALWLLAVALPGLMGCRTDPNILALERENRELDDQVWYLSDQLDLTLRKLESARTKLSKSGEKEKELAPRSTFDREGTKESPSERAAPGASGSSLGPSLSPGASGKRGSPSNETISTPEVVVPSEALPPGQIPKSLQRNGSGSSRFGDPGSDGPAAGKPNPGTPKREKPALDEPSTLLNPPSRKVGLPALGDGRARRLSGEPSRLPESSAPATPMTPPGRPYRVIPVGALAIDASVDSSKVRSITLHRFLTGGLNVDGRPGDEGISVVIEPRDAQGNVVAATGAVSLLVLDPALPRERARVARWDLSAREVAGMFRRLALGASGIALELPWPTDPPRHGRLELFVRFVTSDRRELEVRQQLELTPPGPANVQLASPRAGTSESSRSQAASTASESPEVSLGGANRGERPISPSLLASHWETKPQTLPAAAMARAKPMPNAAEKDEDAPPSRQSPADAQGIAAATSPDSQPATEPSAPARSRAARPEWSPYRSAL